MRRTKRLLFACLVAVVTLEVVLQLGAVVVACCVAPARVANDADVVCVGDSYTFGVGASSPDGSYPGQLEAILRAQGLDVRVANAGFPGQHSGDVLQQVDRQLQAKTRVLCVLLGVNDAWRRPARVAPPDPARTPAAVDPARFRWEWRTGRLLRLVFDFEAGSWQRGVETPAKPAEAPADGTVPLTAEQLAGFLLVADSGLVSTVPRQPCNPPCDPRTPWPELDTIWNAQDPDLANVSRRARAIAERLPDVPAVLACAVETSVRAGERPDAARWALRLEELARQRPTAETAECLAQALFAIGRVEDAITTARRRIAEEPLSIHAWDVLQMGTFALGRREESIRAMAETLNLIGLKEPKRSGFLVRRLARWVLSTDPGISAELAIGALLLDGDLDESRVFLMTAGDRLQPAHFAAVLAKCQIGGRERAQAFWDLAREVQGGGGSTAWRAVLRAHLRDIAAVAARRGVRVVFVGYPFHQDEVEVEQRAAAEELGAPFVAVRKRFDEELRTAPRDRLFVPDGHCSDAGYGLVAGEVAGAVAPLLAR